MKPSEFKRIKHHHTPGDIPKRDKIYMREHHCAQDGRIQGVRGWLNMIYARTRAVLKRRTEREIEEQISDIE